MPRSPASARRVSRCGPAMAGSWNTCSPTVRAIRRSRSATPSSTTSSSSSPRRYWVRRRQRTCCSACGSSTPRSRCRNRVRVIPSRPALPGRYNQHPPTGMQTDGAAYPTHEPVAGFRSRCPHPEPHAGCAGTACLAIGGKPADCGP
ncbi:hypothetical protein CBM2587_B90602 [Cupriavidus taiwanensis]|uniref:Uncharacterized protein n=1 Tax=Cupriavidus taiwanensis TaxID=164546 RepID=A0A375CDH0_9BURK|nr:hypothetical protein CBM2587_B90602 [Cupriavidus taiwanensis]